MYGLDFENNDTHMISPLLQHVTTVKVRLVIQVNKEKNMVDCVRLEA